MSTLLARVLLVSFVGLSTMITYNAVYLQKESHPAPMANDRPGVEKRVARAKTLTRTASIRKITTQNDSTRVAPARSKSILAIQRKLVEKGYDAGPADGVLGVMTRASIMAYQYDHDLPVTGVASDSLLKRMILGESIGDDGRAAAPAIPPETAALVKAVQKLLTALKYEVGPADGIYGAATRGAIRRFEKDRKLAVKGRISAKLLKQISQASGSRISEIYSG